MSDSKLITRYANSHALVIGINEYETASPLRYAVSDAQAIGRALKDDFDFSAENVCLLVDKEATRSAILNSFLSFASGKTDSNDRVVVFFAGHGYTVPSRRGEVGFLVPYDGDSRNLASLIRWDELTRNAGLVDAKHILFLMDACYGGLAITRALKPGSMRFLKDMLLRYARQVLTAGKADEVVADLGGPLPDHSVFTGHLLEGLAGKAADSEGVLSANGLMAYVYQMVGRDSDSQQTPHFGYLDGDGDLIFSAPQLSEAQEEEQKDEDLLVSVPAVMTNEGGGDAMTTVEQATELLSEDRYRIRLHDLVAGQIREALSLTSEDNFSVQGSWSSEEFIERLQKYETVMADLCRIQALLAFWGSEAHRETLTLAVKRIGGRLKPEAGSTRWLAMRWYPVLLLLYAGGVAAVAAGRYDNLRVLMQAIVSDPERSRGEVTLIRGISDAMSDIVDPFKALPGQERHYTPRSEYLFKLLQPTLDDLLFLGADYESHFDRFEVLFALEHAEQWASEEHGQAWGPIGRFGYKFRRRGHSDPLHRVIAEVETQGESWPPIRAGLFRGSVERFNKIASEYTQSVAGLNWR